MAEPELDEYAKDFKWLSREARGPTYNSYSQFSHLPACALEWGTDGYAGLSNNGGELLHLSAPSVKRGLIMARGNFSTTLYAALSRTQVDSGGPSTFGLEIARVDRPYLGAQKNKPAEKASSFQLGTMVERGCFNYRFPFNEYYLDLHPSLKPEQLDPTAAGGAGTSLDPRSPADMRHVGMCQIFSCAMNRIFYQVIRIEQGGHLHDSSELCRHFPKDSQLVLTVGGPVWFRTFDDGDRLHVHDLNEEYEKGDRWPTDCTGDDDTAGEIRLWDNRRAIGLEVRVYQVQGRGQSTTHQRLKLYLSEAPPDSGTYKAQQKSSIRAYNAIVQLPEDKSGHDKDRSAVFITAIRFIESQSYKPPPASVTDNASDREAAGKKEPDGKDNAAAPGIPGDVQPAKGDWPLPPKSEDFYKHIGIDPASPNATGAMWETIFLERRKKTGPVLDLAEVSLIGRSLEKILQVDAVPASFVTVPPLPTPPPENPNGRIPAVGQKENEYDPQRVPEMALVSNVFVKPNVDLKSLFWKVRFLIRAYKFLDRLLQTRPGNSAHGQKGMDASNGNPNSHAGSGASPIDKATLNSGANDGGLTTRFNSTNDSSRDSRANHPAGDRIHPGSTSDQDASGGDWYLNPPETDAQQMVKIAESQKARIKAAVRSIIRYLARAFLEPGVHTPVMPDNHVPGEANYYYVMITIWYAVRTKEFRRWEWNLPKMTGERSERSHCPLFDGRCLPSDNWTFEPLDREKTSLLQWYHYGSILNLCRRKFLSFDWIGECEDRLQAKVLRLANRAKLVASAKLAKLSPRQPYEADDEIIDRLSFLSDELGLFNRKPGRIGEVAMLALMRVKKRDYTRELNPGWLPQPQESSTSGPWELHALCHHSRLVVLTLEEKDKHDWRTREPTNDEIECYKSKIYHFLNAEGTLVPCWERGHARARKGWLRSEATAVVASTLLILNEMDMKDILEPRNEERPTLSNEMTKDGYRRERLLLGIKYMESLMREQLDVLEKSAEEAGRLPRIDWTAFSPTRQYHPPSFFNSLEDTPELYELPKLSDVCLPALLLNHATIPKDLDTAFSYNSIVPLVKYLALFDIAAMGPDKDKEGYTWLVRHRPYIHKAECETVIAKLCEEIKEISKEIDKLEKSQHGLDSAKTTKLLDRRKGLWWKRDALNTHNELLCRAFYDNLVDQEVQHRVLHVTGLNRKQGELPTIPIDILNLIVYVIHTDAATGLGNHALRFSRFSCQVNDTWVASITLRSWRQYNSPRDQESPAQDIDTYDQDRAIYPQNNLKKVWPDSERGLRFELDISTVVLSTNAFGDFSRCTIVSELMADKGKDEMQQLVETARRLWQKFIHQPQTARCLVFFLILGNLCHKIHDEYNKAAKTLARILDKHSRFDRTELEWSRDDNSPLEFELFVWCLDSLHKLQHSLQSSVDSLLLAKEELMKQINDGPGRRGAMLEGMCRDEVGSFESSVMQLVALNARLKQRIELNTMIEESFSSVLAMRDSRASLSQNATVQRLTYLTIGYLPIGLSAAIFAIPYDTGVLYEGMGRTWFVLCIFILSCATYIMAFYIQRLLDIIKGTTSGCTGDGSGGGRAILAKDGKSVLTGDRSWLHSAYSGPFRRRRKKELGAGDKGPRFV